VILDLLGALSLLWIVKLAAVGVFVYVFVKYFKYFMVAGAVVVITFMLVSIFSLFLPLF
jgi:hypothetical protein